MIGRVSEECMKENIMKQAAGSGEIPGLDYGYGRALPISYASALGRAREVLKSEGFGVLCEIDIREKLKEKLGVDFRRYVILGVCNPPLAFETLQREINIGLLLPCNIVVYEDGEGTVVAAIDAVKMLSVVDNPQLTANAGQVNDKLRHVIDSL